VCGGHEPGADLAFLGTVGDLFRELVISTPRENGRAGYSSSCKRPSRYRRRPICGNLGEGSSWGQSVAAMPACQGRRAGAQGRDSVHLASTCSIPPRGSQCPSARRRPCAPSLTSLCRPFGRATTASVASQTGLSAYFPGAAPTRFVISFSPQRLAANRMRSSWSCSGIHVPILASAGSRATVKDG